MGLSDTSTPFLFYSYSHKDDKFRNAMEDSLALLRKNNILHYVV